MSRLAADYGEARARFLAAATSSGSMVESIVHPQRGRNGEELAVDVAHFGPDDASRGLLVVSGTHGVEGFCGSALQSGLIDRVGAELGVGGRAVLVHALNPVGFSWVRRVNEDNVDLNRNCIDWSGPTPANPGYDVIAPLLVPAQWSVEEQERTTAELFEHAMTVGLDQMQADVSGGQYHHPDGVFYGGSGPVWSHRVLAERIMPGLRELDSLQVIDLHTGLGPWAVGELITSYRPDEAGFARASEQWGEVTSMYDGSSTSALLTGDWLDALGGWLPGVEVTAAALEFGTVDNVTVLQALRADAWLHTRGDPTGPESAAIRAQVRAAFADDDPKWFDAVSTRFTEVVEQARAGLRIS